MNRRELLKKLAGTLVILPFVGVNLKDKPIVDKALSGADSSSICWRGHLGDSTRWEAIISQDDYEKLSIIPDYSAKILSLYWELNNRHNCKCELNWEEIE